MKNSFQALLIKNSYLIFIILISFLLYFQSLFVFFTNDDFFHLKISQANNINDFIGFFNPIDRSSGFGFYRPLTTQAFYFLGRVLFDLNPFYLHIAVFLAFFTLIYITYKFTELLSGEKNIALLTAFFYGISPIHFGHLFFLGTFQEIGLAIFYLMSLISFFRFLKSKRLAWYFLSLTGFILSLLSKETAFSLPSALVITFLFLKNNSRLKIQFKSPVRYLIPFFIILAVYLYIHFKYYGTAQGDSYIWDFSVKKLLNTLFWYIGWTLGVPEMFVDFVGPNLSIDPRLFQYWGREVGVLILFFIPFNILLLIKFIRSIRNDFKKIIKILLFSFSWFILTLVPLLFLPLHKFSYELTLPSLAVYFFIAYIIFSEINSRYFVLIPGSIFLAISFLTLELTFRTHWITRGEITARNVYNYMNNNLDRLKGKNVLFYDEPADSDLPWSPTVVLNQVLSGNNFFEVFYGNSITATYGDNKHSGNSVYLRSRDFLGY